MPAKKVLTIGIDPKFIDFSAPEFSGIPGGMSIEKVTMGIEGSLAKLRELGFEAEKCWIDPDDQDQTILNDTLQNNNFDCVLIGAGIRILPKNFLLFEKIINLVHEKAGSAKICFNTVPADSIEAIQRWASV